MSYAGPPQQNVWLLGLLIRHHYQQQQQQQQQRWQWFSVLISSWFDVIFIRVTNCQPLAPSFIAMWYVMVAGTPARVGRSGTACMHLLQPTRKGMLSMRMIGWKTYLDVIHLDSRITLTAESVIYKRDKWWPRPLCRCGFTVTLRIYLELWGEVQISVLCQT